MNIFSDFKANPCHYQAYLDQEVTLYFEVLEAVIYVFFLLFSLLCSLYYSIKRS